MKKAREKRGSKIRGSFKSVIAVMWSPTEVTRISWHLVKLAQLVDFVKLVGLVNLVKLSELSEPSLTSDHSDSCQS